MEIWQVHFTTFFMWWIKDFQKGEFIACNTAQLITKCTLKSAFCFLIEEIKNKNILFFVKELLVIAVVFNKKSKNYMFEIGKKLQPKILYVS